MAVDSAALDELTRISEDLGLYPDWDEATDDRVVIIPLERGRDGGR